MTQVAEKIETRIEKGIHGWRASSRVPLDSGSRVLNIVTMKRSSGALSTVASVAKVDGIWETHAVYDDYYKALASVRVRVSEKACLSLHQQSLESLSQVLAEVKAFYEAKDQKEKVT